MDFIFTLWTADPDLARSADAAGVDRIGVDLEVIGKAARQAGLGTWVSAHGIDDLPALRQAVRSARLFARTNPVGPTTAAEVSTLLRLGVEVLMLPMFRTAAEVRSFLDHVDGRAEVVLLLETKEALIALDELMTIPEVSEVHIGINDLSLALGLANRFCVYLHPAVRKAGHTVRAAGRRLGIGGLARVGDDRLPIPPDLIYAQYPRLGATSALLSRAFLASSHGPVELASEICLARSRLRHWGAASTDQLDHAKRELAEALAQATRW